MRFLDPKTRAGEALLDFIRETKFERLGIFTYSQEEGTVAGKMAGQLSDSVKQKRRQLAMAEQLKVARANAIRYPDFGLRRRHSRMR